MAYQHNHTAAASKMNVSAATQENCRGCAAVLYPQIAPQDFIFAIGQDQGVQTQHGFRTPVYYVAVFARVSDGAQTTRKLLERGPMSPRLPDAWTYLESRMIRAVDKLVLETEQKAKLTSRDRDCRIVFGVNSLFTTASEGPLENAPPSYMEAEAESGPSK